MQNAKKIIDIYASYHTKKLTLVTHFIGVPLIICAIQMILSWIPIRLFGYLVPLSWLVLLPLAIYYCYINIRLTLFTLIFLAALTKIAQILATPHINFISISVFLILFISGWLIQLLGHYHEGNKPAFLENIAHLFIAPLFLMVELKNIFKSQDERRQS